MTREEFKIEIGNFKEIQVLHYFLLNVLNLIWYNGYCCFVKNSRAQTSNFLKENVLYVEYHWSFVILKKKLDLNWKNYLFLKSYHQKLLPYLIECYEIDPRSINYFSFDDFCYLGRDWLTGQKWLITLKEHIGYNEYLKELNDEKIYYSFFYN